MKAVVMAGGEGSRLRPLTINRPKPMVPIVNKPVMAHVLDLLKRHDITDVIVTVQYLASDIQDYFGDGSQIGMSIRYSVEEVPLGTAGSVRQAAGALDETFLVISGDALTDFDLGQIVRTHRTRGARATLVLSQVPNPREFGVVILDDAGRIRQFLEKPGWGEVFSDTVNTGIYVLEPEIFEYYEAGVAVDFSNDVFPRLLRNRDQLFGDVADGYWCDVGSIPEYIRACSDVLHERVNLEPIGHHIGGGVWCESPDTVEISPHAQLFGPIWLGDACQVKAGAIIRGPTVVRDYTIVDERAQVDRSIIWRNSYIGERTEVRGAIVGRQCSLKSKVMVFEGAVIADNTTVNEGAIVQPNVKIWPNKEIEPGASVSSSIIWGSQGRRVIFGRWGVSGLVNIDLTPEFSAKLGAAYGSSLPRGATVTINRDPHRASRMLKRALIAGLPSAGVNVVDLKTLPIPAARYITGSDGYQGGIHVRVSPFDDRIVDVKFFDHRGLDISQAGERKVENIFFREDYRRAYLDEIGMIREADELVGLYVEALRKALHAPAAGRGAAIAVDYGNSPSAQILPGILNGLGLEVVALNGSIDETRLARTVDEFEGLMGQLAAVARSLGVELAVRLEAGGEKIYAVDDRGARVRGWDLLAAVATLLWRDQRGGTLAVPVNAPSVFERLATENGGAVVRTKVNAATIMAAATQDGVFLAGDGDGGIVFPDFQPAMDGLYAVAKLHELLSRHGVRLSDVLAALPTYHMVRTKVPCSWENKGRVMRMLSQQFREAVRTQVDGIRIDLGDEWVLVLPDMDRPIFHVFAESSSPDGARVLMDKYATLVSSLQR